MASTLSQDTITFGKYKGKTLTNVLRDRSYCKWLLLPEQNWFREQYEYLYNRVKDYNPIISFLSPDINPNDPFLRRYKYFNLKSPSDITLPLSENEITCYTYYIKTIDTLKDKIKDREDCENIYDIKAPVKWLQTFEKETGLRREEFKEFLSAYDLPNIPYIIEDIKKEGGLEYKGAQSFNIAKQRSLRQESFWVELLKTKYGDDIGVQFKYEKCIFDAICIPTGTIYECKLNIKDFNEDQFRKYELVMNKYRLVYLIGYETIIDTKAKIIYTMENGNYILYQASIRTMKNPSRFDLMLQTYTVRAVMNFDSVL